MSAVKNHPKKTPLPPMSLEELLLSLRLLFQKRAYRPHQPFLSQYETQRRFGVPMHVAKQALHRLEEERILYRVHRKGSFVSPPARHRPYLCVAHDGYSPASPGPAQTEIEPHIGSWARLRFLEGLMAGLARPESRGFVLLESAARLRQARYDLTHVFPKLAGVVIFRDPDLAEEMAPVLAEQGIPLAFYGSSVFEARLGGQHRMLVDERQVARLALEHLAATGRRRIACVHTAGSPAHGERLIQTRTLTGSLGLHLVAELPIDFAKPRAEWFANFDRERRKNRVEAVFATDDDVATHLVNHLVRSGSRVPRDLAVLGVNNAPLAYHGVVPLSSVDIPLARDAARLMESFERISEGNLSNASPLDLRSNPNLVCRESA